MPLLRAALLPSLVFAAACATKAPVESTPSPTPEVAVPTTRMSESTLTLWETEVPDPYDWLEDLDAPEVTAWVTAQNTAARTHLDTLPGRDALSARFAALWERDDHGSPVMEGGMAFASFRAAGADQAVLRVTPTDGEPRVLLDPNTWTEDGTKALTGWAPSPDGAYVAYGTADAGSDWNVWHVVRVEDGTVLEDTLEWVKFSGASWLPDGSGFLYSRFPAPETGAYEEKLSDQQVWFHRVGTPQSSDIRVLATPDHPQWGFWAGVDDEGTRVLLHVSEGTDERNRLWVLDLADLDLSTAGATLEVSPTRLRDRFDAEWLPIGTVGDTLLAVTDKDAPTRKVVSIPLGGTEAEPAAVDVVPAREGATLERALLADGHLVLSWLVDARAEVTIHTLDGALRHTVALPGLGSVSGWTGELDEPVAYFRFEGFTTPDTILGLDPSEGTTTTVVAATLDVDPDAFVTEQVFYESKDGTQVPMFLVHRADVTPDGERPVYLYGYGGFDIPITPSFKTEYLVWAEQGGVVAVANLRGGGEYGRDWHAAGTKQSKQNVFDDFIAAGEHLVASGWTSPAHLGIHGRSNGGLLVGATVTQRPDLFAAAVPGVGVLDMLKYHTWTIGWAWASDYGTVDDSEAMFRYLLGYSPVHNARAGTAYPPTLIMTADHDDRVVPGHSYKFAAALQAAHTGSNPVVLRVETRAGHGAGMPVSMKIEESVDRVAFLAAHTGLAIAGSSAE